MYTSTFFKWIICHENGKRAIKMLKVYEITPPPKRVCFVHCLTLTIMDSHLVDRTSMICWTFLVDIKNVLPPPQV